MTPTKITTPRGDLFLDEKEVLDIRNKLAHARSEVIDDIECLVVDGGEPEQYDSQKCKEIRKRLKKYSTCLDEIHDIISKKE